MKNEIYLGDPAAPLYYFGDDTLIITGGVSTVDLVSNELSIDQLKPKVIYTWYIKSYLQPIDADCLLTSDGKILYGYWNDNLAELPYATPVWFYRDGKPRGRYFLHKAERVGRDQWAIHAVSEMGLLDLIPHRGGIFRNTTVAQMLTQFFGGSVGESTGGVTPIEGGLVPIYVDNAVAVTTVQGLLPYADSSRDNLHQLIFSYCVNVQRTDDGGLLFTYLQPAEDPPYIEEDRLVIGGNITYDQPITDVELTEYTYVWDETAEPEKVYDNTKFPATEGETLVEFSKPINPETITVSNPDMVVRDANEVTAYVTGNGIISAVPYQIQERILTRSVEGRTIRKSISVKNVTLVNPLNSNNLISKLFEFYTQRRVVDVDIQLEDERPGQLYSFIDPHGQLQRGFLSSADWSASGIMRGRCQLITNYTPTGVSTNMQNMALLTGSGEWTVPPGVRERENPVIRAVIMGGGQGGHGGYPGANSGERPDSPGEGGRPGEGGEGGEVLIVEINVRDIESFVYACGEGGEGGRSGQAGSLGGATTFGAYSSAQSPTIPEGILNLIDGQIYARRGRPGIAGAAGGEGAQSSGSTPTLADIAKYGEDGQPLTVGSTTWRGGKGGRSIFAVNGVYTGWAFGSGGGGAAYGADGNDGMDGYVEWGAVIGGFGGEGATATIPGTDAQFAACGGNGGNGGGGAGAPGDSGWNMGTSPTGYPGEGGRGSVGGRGAPGAILIYY